MWKVNISAQDKSYGHIRVSGDVMTGHLMVASQGHNLVLFWRIRSGSAHYTSQTTAIPGHKSQLLPIESFGTNAIEVKIMLCILWWDRVSINDETLGEERKYGH